MEKLWDIIVAMWPAWLASYLVFVLLATTFDRWYVGRQRKKILKATIELRAWRNVARLKRKIEVLKAIRNQQLLERNAAPCEPCESSSSQPTS